MKIIDIRHNSDDHLIGYKVVELFSVVINIHLHKKQIHYVQIISAKINNLFFPHIFH